MTERSNDPKVPSGRGRAEAAGVLDPPGGLGGRGGAESEVAGPDIWLDDLDVAEPRPRASLREMLCVAALVALADVTVYHGHGFTGAAACLAGALPLLALASPRHRKPLWPACLAVGGMLLVLAARLVWLGGGLLAALGVFLLVAFAAALAGLRPFVLDVLAYAGQSVAAGLVGLRDYRFTAGTSTTHAGRRRVGAAAIWLPAAALVGFGTLFVLANPDLSRAAGEWIEWAWLEFNERFTDWFPEPLQVLFWVAVGWFAVGLLRPLMKRSVLAWVQEAAAVAEPYGTNGTDDTDGKNDAPAEAPLYPALRNTLVAVIGLFAAYLVFEFGTLWRRDFPEGFYYAGYAHHGAAYLTLALALATLVLSGVFRGATLRDPRVGRLRRLAWAWSVENALLSLAVYNRLLIYIDFNGMTRMRTVGLLGITAVVVGFVLVVRKIAAGRDFLWLLRRQLWTLAAAVYLYAVLPVDTLVHTYNVRRILAGDPAPSVQITEHPVDAGGVLVLPPLVRAEDPVIREGIRALLAERAARVQDRLAHQRRADWTSFQWSDRVLHERLEAIRSEWSGYADRDRRAAALHRFREYAYRWY